MYLDDFVEKLYAYMCSGVRDAYTTGHLDTSNSCTDICEQKFHFFIYLFIVYPIFDRYVNFI